MRAYDNRDSLLFLEEPAEEIRAYFGVGRFDYPPNRVEQGGWLVGVYMEDSRTTRVQGLVTHFLPATGCTGTAAYLHWPAMENIRLQRRFAALKEELEEKDPGLARQICLLGWIHSHPNRLPVFLSTTDFENIRDHFNDPHQFSVVLNPQTRECRAFLGPEGREVPMAVHPIGKDQPAEPEKPDQQESVRTEAAPVKPLKREKRPYRKAVYGKAPGGKRRRRGRKKGR